MYKLLSGSKNLAFPFKLQEENESFLHSNAIAHYGGREDSPALTSQFDCNPFLVIQLRITSGSLDFGRMVQASSVQDP